MARRRVSATVLDRDGVINLDSPAYIKHPDEWQPIPGSIEAIAALSRAGLRVFVVTNQSAVGRGLLTVESLERIHARMLAAVAAAGGAIEDIYYCPHVPADDCECRKPRTGLLRRLEAEHSLALAGQPFVGDKWSDLLAARAVDARPILVLTGAGAETLAAHADRIGERYPDLAAAAQAILEARA